MTYKVLWQASEKQLRVFFDECKEKGAPALAFHAVYNKEQGYHVMATMLDPDGVEVQGIFPLEAAKHWISALEVITEIEGEKECPQQDT